MHIYKRLVRGFVSAFICIILLFSASLGSLAAEVELEDAAISFNSVSGAPGETVTLTFSFSAAGEFSYVMVNPTYDDTALTLNDCKTSEFTITYANLRYTIAKDSDFTPFSPGDYAAQFEFIISADAVPGDYPIEFDTARSYFYVNAYDRDRAIVRTPGTITVLGEGGGGDPEPTVPTPLTAPVLNGTPESKASDSITLVPPVLSAQDASAAVQYRGKLTSGDTWGAWQTSPTFGGLEPETSYSFQAKYVAATTATWSDSEPSAAVAIVTEAAAQEPPETPTTAYTIAPSVTSNAATVGEQITVAVAVTAGDTAAAFAAVDATLNFDSTKVQFVSATLDAAPPWTTGVASNNGKIAGYGSAIPVGSGVTVAT
jgi:hypothetical protein